MGEHRRPRPPSRPRFQEVTIEPEPGAVIPSWYWVLSPFQYWHATGGRVTAQERASMAAMSLTVMAALGSW